MGGKRGCLCGKHRGASGAKDSRGDGGCTCEVKPFLDVEGNYSLNLLRNFDPSWATQVDTGIPWELLNPRMDIEEPGAALIISIALNKKNEIAMQTAHTEVMHTLVKLCKTDPYSGAVAFEPIRDKMLELYGSTIDHPDFHHAIRVVMDSGGSESPHMKDMQDFTYVHVNPRLRKLRLGLTQWLPHWPSTGHG